MAIRHHRSVAVFMLCLSVAGLAIGLALYLGLTGPQPDLWTVLFFGALSMIAANASVDLPNESAMSASFMLSIAAVVVFHGNAELFGPLVVGMLAGFYLPNVRERQFHKLLFNVGNLGLSTVAAAAIHSVVPENVLASVPGQLAAAVPTGLTYSLVNFILLTLAILQMNFGWAICRFTRSRSWACCSDGST